MLAGVLSAHAAITPVRHKHRMVAASTSHRLVAHSVRRTRAEPAYRHAEGGARGGGVCQSEGMRAMVRVGARRGRVRSYGERFTASSFTDVNALTANDVSAGEDPVVRAAAVEAWAI